MKVFTPPVYPKFNNSVTNTFLAGSIEMGKAENWQDKVINHLKDVDVEIYNPRRTDWDNNWEQSIDNPKFVEQVEWELNYLSNVDLIALYFSPGTVSPISLLEMGLHINSGKILICCPRGFQRKGNVDIVAKRYNIPVVEDFNEWLDILGQEIKHNNNIISSLK